MFNSSRTPVLPADICYRSPREYRRAKPVISLTKTFWTLVVACVLTSLFTPQLMAQQQPFPRIASPYPLNQEIHPGDTYMGVRLLGALKLDSIRIDDVLLGGLSALGWDHDEQVLYALSDYGYIFHLRLEFDEQDLLRDAHVLAVHALLDARGKALRGRLADSEGLVVRYGNNGKANDSQLAISFERRPRIVRFDPRA